MIQLGLRISNQSVLQSTVENLIKWVPAFHITTDDEYYYRNEEPTPVFQLPKLKIKRPKSSTARRNEAEKSSRKKADF